jgi:hypothetical protein
LKAKRQASTPARVGMEADPYSFSPMYR